MNKLFFKCLLMTLSLGLLGCQSVDYYGKSYEKNGFFHCMVLENPFLNMYGYITEHDKENCSDYKEILKRRISQMNLIQEKKYYENNGAKCINIDNILNCNYTSQYAQNVMYDAYTYYDFRVKINSDKNKTQFRSYIKNCESNFMSCSQPSEVNGHNIFIIK